MWNKLVGVSTGLGADNVVTGKQNFKSIPRVLLLISFVVLILQVFKSPDFRRHIQTVIFFSIARFVPCKLVSQQCRVANPRTCSRFFDQANKKNSKQPAATPFDHLNENSPVLRVGRKSEAKNSLVVFRQCCLGKRSRRKFSAVQPSFFRRFIGSQSIHLFLEDALTYTKHDIVFDLIAESYSIDVQLLLSLWYESYRESLKRDASIRETPESFGLDAKLVKAKRVVVDSFCLSNLAARVLARLYMVSYVEIKVIGLACPDLDRICTELFRTCELRLAVTDVCVEDFPRLEHNEFPNNTLPSLTTLRLHWTSSQGFSDDQELSDEEKRREEIYEKRLYHVPVTVKSLHVAMITTWLDVCRAWNLRSVIVDRYPSNMKQLWNGLDCVHKWIVLQFPLFERVVVRLIRNCELWHEKRLDENGNKLLFSEHAGVEAQRMYIDCYDGVRTVLLNRCENPTLPNA